MRQYNCMYMVNICTLWQGIVWYLVAIENFLISDYLHVTFFCCSLLLTFYHQGVDLYDHTKLFLWRTLNYYKTLIYVPSLQFPFALTAFTSLQFCFTVSACVHKPAVHKTIRIVTGWIADYKHVLSVAEFVRTFTF